MIYKRSDFIEKEFEIEGSVSVPQELSYNEFWHTFIRFIESNDWSFGGGINEIIDAYYIYLDGSKGKHVSEDIK